MTVPRWLHKYFQHLLPLSECTAEDGRVVGFLLMDVVESSPKDQALPNAIREFAHRTEMLRESIFRHIGAMLTHMLCSDQGVPNGAAAASVAADIDQADPDLVMEHEAEAIGNSLGALASSMHVAICPTAVLHGAVMSCPVLRTMAARYVWFIPMLEVLLDPRTAELHRDGATWIDDVAHDSAQRQDRIAAMELASGCVYSSTENEMIRIGLEMFTRFEASSAGAKQLTHSATVLYSETKLDAATGLLLGRAAAMVRASPQEIVAFFLNYDSRFNQSTTDPTVFIRSEVVAHVNAHHVIIFNRFKLGAGLSQRTFLNSAVAKKVHDDPFTYLLVSLPIAQHDKVTAKDEKRAVRAEACRAFKLTEVAAGITKLEYTCSLNLRGSIPQAITNKVSVPGQMHGAPPPNGSRTRALQCSRLVSLAHDTRSRENDVRVDTVAVGCSADDGAAVLPANSASREV